MCIAYWNDCIDCNSEICTNKVVKCNHAHTEAQQKLLTLSLNYILTTRIIAI